MSDRLQMGICYLYIYVFNVVRYTLILCNNELLDISEWGGRIQEETRNCSVKVVVDSRSNPPTRQAFSVTHEAQRPTTLLAWLLDHAMLVNTGS